MNYVKVLASLSVFSACVSSYGAVSLSGTAFLNVPGISVGDVAVFVIDNGNTNTASGFAGIQAGESLTSGLTYGNGDFTVLTPTREFAALSTFVRLDGTYLGISINSTVTPGDRFYVVVFSNSTTTAIAGDTYTVWNDPTWIIPADGNTVTYAAAPTGTQLRQLGASSVAAFTGVVAGAPIPEPSTAAALGGLIALGAVATRRRRAA